MIDAREDPPLSSQLRCRGVFLGGFFLHPLFCFPSYLLYARRPAVSGPTSGTPSGGRRGKKKEEKKKPRRFPPPPSSSDVVHAEKFALNVHDVVHGGVGEDTTHPEGVAQGRGGPWVARVRGQRERGRRPAADRTGEELGAGRIGAAHVFQPSGHVHGLPLPPQTVEVGVMEEEDGITGGGLGQRHLLYVSIYVYISRLYLLFLSLSHTHTQTHIGNVTLGTIDAHHHQERGGGGFLHTKPPVAECPAVWGPGAS